MEESATTGDVSDVERPLAAREVFGWVELGCWTMVGLTPLLYWVNGPAVSTDQLVVRSGLVGFALGGGLVLRLAASLRGAEAGGRRSSCDDDAGCPGGEAAEAAEGPAGGKGATDGT
ncbi:MAG: hypothetical protein NTW96_24380 [Planctomycetia bacterium]|nr:hypothetical protein [Planctomycetia bacterium]